MSITVGIVYLIFFCAIMAIPIMVGIYVYRDATNRQMNAALWTLIAVLAPMLIGLIIYLVVRSDYSARQCPHCARPLEPTWKICPDCGATVPDYQNMPVQNSAKDKGLRNILIAVILIILLIMAVLMAGLTGLRSSFSGSISSTGGMRVEDFQTNKTISAWLKKSDASGNGIYVLENQRPEGNTEIKASYIIYRKGLMNSVEVSAEGKTKSLFSGSKLLVKYLDSGLKAPQDYHLYQIDYITSDEPKFEIYVDGKEATYKTTKTNEPLSFVGQIPWRNGADNLFNARIDYLGDNSSVLNLIEETDIPALGEFSIELKTSAKPFGLRILYASPINESKGLLFSTNSIQLLGLIKNLDYVEITDGEFTYKITSDDASAKLGFDVKELGKSRDTLEKYLLTVYE